MTRMLTFGSDESQWPIEVFCLESDNGLDSMAYIPYGSELLKSLSDNRVNLPS